MRTSAGMSSDFVSPTSGWMNRPSTRLQRRLRDVLVGAVDRVAGLEADDRLPAALGERGARGGRGQQVRPERPRGAPEGPWRGRGRRCSACPPRGSPRRRGARSRSCGRRGAPRARGHARRPPRRRSRRAGRPSSSRRASRSPSAAPASVARVTGMLHGRPLASRISSTTRRQSSEPWNPRSGLNPRSRAARGPRPASGERDGVERTRSFVSSSRFSARASRSTSSPPWGSITMPELL